ncbi:MAG: hypothetical protein VB080_11970 [Propionicimonas sp.]|uniref:hypothetical protein n=1 Tax=Propionicimonas sp. TaxID=1955623 RepID=UPI002B1FC4B1|nr:hypothetical protein [Propionicimonas sp.]MEA4945139.1 hypothetical protein [Propionicimonas sp.]
MGMILAMVVALVASAGAALLVRALPGWRERIGRGGPVWLGLALALLVLGLTGEAPKLALILLGAALVAGLVETLLVLAGAPWALRLVGQGLVIVATLGVEYLRGDLFASTAAIGVAGGVVVFNVVAFATRGAQLSGAGRTPALLAVAGALSLFAIAWGIPNPGLATVVLVVAAAVLPLAVLPAVRPEADQALGPVLAAVAWATGLYAWLANASPAMVLAPLAIVGLDVVWTLVRRLLTRAGRERLASTGGWWRRLNAWAEPADDLVGQRAAAATSVPAAVGWLAGFTVVALGLSIVTWLLGTRWTFAAALLLLLGLGWLLLQLASIGLRRAELVAWLVGLTVVGGILGVGGHLIDGRWLIVLLPLVVVAGVWLAAIPRLRARRG